MSVTAKFVPERINLFPNVPTTVTLRLYNGDVDVRRVTMSLTGDLVGVVSLDATEATLETNQIVDVNLTIEVPSTVEAGVHTVSVEVALAAAGVEIGAGTANEPASDSSIATLVPSAPATIDPTIVVASLVADVVAHHDFTTELRPSHSRSSSVGRHSLHVVNTGNVPVTIELLTDGVTDGAVVDVAETSLVLAPGTVVDTAIRVTPNTTYWSGPNRTFDFTVRATSVDGRVDEHIGSYQQRPRVPNWVGPAAAGALAALVIGAIAWFALLRPWVQDTADQAAAEAIELDRAALQLRIDELEAAASNAKELPLGTPTDLRLDVAPSAGSSDESATSPESGTRLSITDVVLENPSGAVGTVTVQRGDDVLLRSELANFRDFDRHFVAPFVFQGGQQLVLSVECETPGPGGSDCPVGASFVGFVDEAD